MANTKVNLQNYIRFIISNDSGNSIVVNNIKGWQDIGLDAMRNLDYHGVLTKVSNELSFTGEVKEFIYNEYKLKKVLGKINLVVYKLEELNGNVKWVEKYFLFADFNTMKTKNGVLSIMFNSNSLMELLDAYEDQDFEIGRLEDINNEPINELQEEYVAINGRSINSNGQGKFKSGNYTSFKRGIQTEMIKEGPHRHSSQTSNQTSITSNNMFYDFVTTEEPDKTLTIKFNIEYLSVDPGTYFSVRKYKMINENTGQFNLLETDNIYQEIEGQPKEFFGEREYTVKFDECLSFYMFTDIYQDGYVRSENIIGTYKIEEVEFYEPSPNIKFLFFSDVLFRLMFIITGRENSFHSNILSRKEISGNTEDGKYGLIGFISGLWVRGFEKDNERYKSPVLSFKDGIQSICNIFNLGSGIETIGSQERVIVEDINYFYRNEIAGSFIDQISNEERVVADKMYYSSLQFGYEKVQKLDQEMGLDEPNVKSDFISPIYSSKNKFTKFSKIRADEYKLETLRRKSVITHGDDSLSGDEDNWLLDLKRKDSDTDVHDFKQVHWSDRLAKEPNGIHDPESFTSMIFTPMRMMLRLSSLFNSGLYSFKEKFVNFTSSLSNRDLSMQFIGEDVEYKESDNVKISNLNKPIFKNEIITFTHPYSKEVEDLIFGKTKVTINGEQREIPNFYFKIEWINEKGDLERGYFLKYEYSDNPTFEFLIANEEII